uniref:Uncharacterized protein n=1 Tax=Nothobranchius korthausae TaxID=1143690 RepID=A0A1A8HJ27_9TELE
MFEEENVDLIVEITPAARSLLLSWLLKWPFFWFVCLFFTFTKAAKKTGKRHNPQQRVAGLHREKVVLCTGKQPCLLWVRKYPMLLGVVDFSAKHTEEKRRWTSLTWSEFHSDFDCGLLSWNTLLCC